MLVANPASDNPLRPTRYMSREGGVPWSNWLLDFSTGRWREADTTESHWGCACTRMVPDEA